MDFDEGMNYLFIILDSCRYDVFIEANTPFFDSLGKVYKAYTNSNWTPSSFVNFFGHGQFPHLKGLTVAETYQGLLKQELNFMSHLTGYRKILFTGMPWLSKVNHGVRSTLELFNDYVFLNRIQVAKRAVKYYNNWAKEPYFFVMWLGETHQPYSVEGDVTLWKGQELVEYNKGMDTVSMEYLEYLKDRQRRMVEYCDKELSKLRIRDNTLVVITADHGESFGENHIFGHGNDIHPVQFEVPLIVSKI